MTPPTHATPAPAWSPRRDVVEKFLADRPGFRFEESQVPAYSLPPLWEETAGSPAPAEWSKRRGEILGLYTESVFGKSPGRPASMHFSLIEENPRALGGKARLQEVEIRCFFGEKELAFTCHLVLPNAVPAPVPVFLLLNNRRPHLTDPAQETPSEFWPAEKVIDRGYGVAAIQTRELAPDSGEDYRNGVIDFFGQKAGEPPANAWGALAAWAWGASRAMDYFETNPAVDTARVAVVGHSRGGKAALWAGATDERFALVVSNASGCGGAALHRRRFGETLARMNERYPYWFCRNFQSFADREDELPVDQHMLLALIAPRAVYVSSADEDLWADPRGEYLALASASPAFELFGHTGLSTDVMPAKDHAVHGDRQGYHIRSGGHDLTAADWTRFMDFADRLWKRTPETR